MMVTRSSKKTVASSQENITSLEEDHVLPFPNLPSNSAEDPSSANFPISQNVIVSEPIFTMSNSLSTFYPLPECSMPVTLMNTGRRETDNPHREPSYVDQELWEEELDIEQEQLNMRKKRLALAKASIVGSQLSPGLKVPPQHKPVPTVLDAPASTGMEALVETLRSLTVGMALPKVEIETFSGAPEEFVTFLHTFVNQVESQISDPHQRLCQLIHYCRGVAKEAIRHCVLLPKETAYQTAVNILKSQFGRPHQIIQAVTNSLFSGPPIRANDLFGLQEMLRQMRSTSITLTQLNRSSDLNCTTNLLRVVRRLPKPIQNKWAEIVEALLAVGKEPSFEDLLTLVERRVSIASTEYGMLASESGQFSVAKQTHRVASVKQVEQSNMCPLCDVMHRLESCPDFAAKDVATRWQLLKEHHRCFRCLGGNHRITSCKSRDKCQVDGCSKWHHPLLHSTDRVRVTHVNDGHVCSSFSLQSKGIQLGFVPVKLIGPTGTVLTYAFLDNGSDCTLVEKGLAKLIGLVAEPTSLRIATLHGEKAVSCSQSKATLASLDSDYVGELDPLIVVDRLPVNRIDRPHLDTSKWPHLSDVTVCSLSSDRVGLLIGCDVPDAHKILEQRIGTSKEPFASKSVLGWIVRGPVGSNENRIRRVNSIVAQNLCIEDLLVRLYDSEINDCETSEETQPSVEDMKALRLVEDSCTVVDGHYELAIPWRRDDFTIDGNKQMALKRLQHLRQRLKRDNTLFEKYTENIHDHIRKGYICLGGESPKRWFLPHHPVINPKKPEKLRIVFDCAARFRGISLNDTIMQGPDLTNKLTGVLLRFRKHKIALAADIKEMFLQVKMPKKDRWAFSFLWWENDDLDGAIVTYEWNVHPFGVTSSPFCANYALQRSIKDNIDDYEPELSESVLGNFYVDDYLSSTGSLEEALTIVRKLPKLLKRGGFDLVKWNSNCEEVVRQFDSNMNSNPLQLLALDQSCSSVLGIKWHILKDVFIFDMADPVSQLTRRTLLSYLASIYDPLGFICPALLPGKLILQELCRTNIGWDAPLGPHVSTEYSKWVESLSLIRTLEITRCLVPNANSNARFELHVFSDASEKGYGVVAYLRQTTNNQTYDCSFLLGKSRVAPLKFVTIPRLELCAALLAAKSASHITQELCLDLHRVVFWTDSTIVLRYLANTTTRFLTFVANRVRRIQELSEPSQWRYVSTEHNPADMASRGISSDFDLKFSTWLNGPLFLRAHESTWPKWSQPSNVPDENLEVKRVMAIVDTSSDSTWLHNIADRSPDWVCFLRRIVWLTRFVKYITLKHSSRTDVSIDVGHIKVRDLVHASREVIRMTQVETYDINNLKGASDYRRWPVELQKLKPTVIDGILHLGGRVTSSPLPIIPSKGRITELLIIHHHTRCGHSGASHVLAELRREYWIVGGMSAVRRVLRKCYECRLLHTKPCQQQMAPLPSVRTEPESFPFSHVGLDYFGPFMVKQNRSEVKRFGCLFTCMKTRAIHIEVAHNMSTDSFLMAANRFFSRRGIPKAFFSDNGSNFIGAEAELRTLCESLKNKTIYDAMSALRIEWNFNPPYASHRGGVWERMIRTVRKVLAHLMREQVVSDEVLLTCLAEAERIVNDRPLVPVYDDPEHPKALCPNDLLLLRPNSGFVSDEIPLRERLTKRWKQAQHLANVFWKRWRQDYLPTLQAYQKWLKPQPNLKAGDLVLLLKTDAPRGHWPKGLVTESYPGPDGLVRQVLVKTNAGLVRRDVRSLCLLEGAEE